jgi:hypothetical protein
MDLLTTFTYHSELQVITALSLISTFYRSLQYSISLLSYWCVLISPYLVTATNSGDSLASRSGSIFTFSFAEVSSQLTTPRLAAIWTSLIVFSSQADFLWLLHSIILMPHFCFLAYILAGWRLETQLTQTIYFALFITPRHGPHRKRSSSTAACVHLRGNVFNQLFHSNGYTRHI